MLQLLTAATGLPLLDAVDRMSARVSTVDVEAFTEAEISKYHDMIVAPRNAASKLWDDARSSLARPSDHAQMLLGAHRLNLRCSPERWARLVTPALGETTRQAALTALQPSYFRNSGICPTALIFRGVRYSWDRVLTMAYHSAPGRICGFRFLGRQGHRPADEAHFVFKSASRSISEAGLGMLELLDRAGSGPVIAIPDWLLAWRIQMRRFVSDDGPLPIVVWYDDGHVTRTEDTWSLLNREVVFWSRTPDPIMIRHAVRCDARISLSGPTRDDDETVSHYLRLHSPAELMAHITKLAKPWPEALKDWMGKAGDAKARKLISDLEETGQDVDRIMRMCDRKRTISPRRTVKTVQSGSISYQIGPHGLYIKSGAKVAPVINAVPLVHEIVNDRGSDRYTLRGVINTDGRAIPFTLSSDEVAESSALSWLKTRLADEELPFQMHRRISHERLMEVVFAVRQPTITKENFMLGWQPEESRFRLLTSTVDTQGNIERASTMPRELAKALKPPMPLGSKTLSPEHKFPVGASESIDEFVCTLGSCIAANVLAPAFGRPQLGIAVAGRIDQTTLEEWARTMGCPMVSVKGEYANFEEIEAGTNWPVVANFPARMSSQDKDEWASARIANKYRNAIAKLPPISAACRVVDHNWMILRNDGLVSAADKWMATGVVQAYIVDLCRRNLDINRHSPDWWSDVYDDFVNFYGRRRDGEPFRRSRKERYKAMVNTPRTSAVDLFLAAVSGLQRRGVLGDEVCHTTDTYLRLTIDSVYDAIRGQGAVPPAKDRVVSAFRQRLQEPFGEGGRVWSIPLAAVEQAAKSQVGGLL